MNDALLRASLRRAGVGPAARWRAMPRRAFGERLGAYCAPTDSRTLTLKEQHWLLLRVVQPLVELAGDVDCVFTEDDAMAPEKRQMSMGRLYRAWKEFRDVLDAEYDPSEDQRDGTQTASGGRGGTGHAVLTTRRPVLRSGRRWAQRGGSFGA